MEDSKQTPGEIWLARYHQEYDKLPPIETFPESEREAEYKRREAKRHDLYADADAPKAIAQTQVERIKEQFRTYYGVRSLTKEPFPDRDRLNDWIESNFDHVTVPDFDNLKLNRLANDLEIGLTREEQNERLGGAPVDEFEGPMLKSQAAKKCGITVRTFMQRTVPNKRGVVEIRIIELTDRDIKVHSGDFAKHKKSKP